MILSMAVYLYQNPTCTGKDIGNINVKFRWVSVEHTESKNIFRVKPNDKFSFKLTFILFIKSFKKTVQKLAASKETF